VVVVVMMMMVMMVVLSQLRASTRPSALSIVRV
jgi:hypothetical protein